MILWTWDEDRPRIREDRSYFGRSHVNDTFPGRGAVEWQWTLAEIITAVAAAGMLLAAVLQRTTMNYMSQPLSVRLNDATISRLGARAQRVHLAPRTLAQRYVEEGLRMDEHPLVRFAEGPAGRRARLIGTGKDVWEVIAVVRDNGGDAAESARYLEIPLGLVQAAITYYGAYAAEIDQQVEANEREAAEAHAAYLAGQAALRR